MSTIQERSESRDIPNISGKVMTVRGPINPSDLGTTIMHEHILVDLRLRIRPDYYTPATEIALWDENRELTLDNLHLARELKPIGEDALFSDAGLAIREAIYFRNVGGNTIVDCASNGMRHDPLGLRRISYATGVNIIISSGWYQKQYHPEDMDQRTVEDMTDEIIRDVTVGVGETGIRSGVIGEVGIDGSPIIANEIKSIKATARASKATGAAITFHRSGVGRDENLRVVSTVGEEGADLSRTILDHSDFIAMQVPLLKELARLGPYIEFDLLGKLDVPLMYSPPTPNRVYVGWSVNSVVAEAIVALVEAGHEDRILLSHDSFPKLQFKAYGGTGWSFILQKFLPHLRAMGITEEQTTKFMVENPKRALTFVEPG